MRVHSTGALLDIKNPKLAETFFWLYQKVSNQDSLVRPTIGLVFDRKVKQINSVKI